MQNSKTKAGKAIISVFLFSMLHMGSAFADTYKVKVTNLTGGQTFTPRLAITHSAGNAFMLGNAASSELATIAEEGDSGPMQALLQNPEIAGFISDSYVSEGGLLEPGQSETFTISANSSDKFTLLNMIIPSNDGFIGINAVSLPESGSASYRGVVYDAGTEPNDENCANIPGPVCGGSGLSADAGGEGFIHVHPGIHGIADLDAAAYDWRNPAVMVVISKQ